VNAGERGHGSAEAWCGLRMVFGPLVEWMVEALEGAVVLGGLSALGAALYSMGIPEDSIVEYETALKAAKFLVITQSTADEMATANSILETTSVAQVATYQGYIESTGP
jgi:predicted alpha/beta-hydrolase family hydrolase